MLVSLPRQRYCVLFFIFFTSAFINFFILTTELVIFIEGEIPSITFDDDNRFWIVSNRNNSSSHPHMGARHPNGTLGMVINVSTDRLLSYYNSNSIYGSPPIDYHHMCPTNDSLLLEGRGGHKVLQKIRGGLSLSREFLLLQEKAITDQIKEVEKPLTDAELKTTKTLIIEHDDKGITEGISNMTIVRAKRSRILCMVYSTHLPPTYDNQNVKAQASTWGKKCDGFFVASNYTDHATGSIDLPHLGPESYSSIWQKARSMWAYAYDNYRDDYDFFYICGDDVYAVVENLRAFVDGPHVLRLENGYLDSLARSRREKGNFNKRPRPLVLGHPLRYRACLIPSGGPGYILNRAALELLVEVGLPSHRPDEIRSMEDIFLGQFFCHQKVFLSDAVDAKGGTRFGESAAFSYDFFGLKFAAQDQKPMMDDFGFKISQKGTDYVSAQQVGMHLKLDRKRLKWHCNSTIAELIYRYHAFFYDWCEKMTDDYKTSHTRGSRLLRKSKRNKVCSAPYRH